MREKRTNHQTGAARTRRAIRLGAIAAAVPLVAVGTASAASAEPDPPPNTLSIDGSLQLVPGFNVLHIVAQGDTDADGAASGTYDATVQLGDSELPVAVHGPVTCLTTEGDTASLVYPIDSLDPDVLPGSLAGEFAVQVTVTDGENGEPDMVGLAGPAPTDSFDGCAPGPAPFVFDGDVDIND
ncbi:MAG: hypothetical protein L0H59_09825 [Tomitella sp.]|nr:hypothetical protein [Tomitella sp.]